MSYRCKVPECPEFGKSFEAFDAMGRHYVTHRKFLPKAKMGQKTAELLGGEGKVVNHLAPLLQSIISDMKGLSIKVESVYNRISPVDQLPAFFNQLHPMGLCNEATCEECQSKVREISHLAQERFLVDLDSAAVRAGLEMERDLLVKAIKDQTFQRQIKIVK